MSDETIRARIEADIAQYKKSLREARRELAELAKGGDDASKSAENLSRKTDEADKSTRKQAAGAGELRRQMDAMRAALNGSTEAMVDLATAAVRSGGLLGGMGVAAAAFGTAAAVGYVETQRLNKAVILSGGIAGQTTGQLLELARSVGDVSGSQSEAIGVMTRLAGESGMSAEALRRITLTAIELEDVGGAAVKNTVDAFVSLADAPVEASIKLNEQYQFLTLAVFEQIRALEDQGRTQAATEVAQNALADALQERTRRAAEDVGTLEKVWDGLRKTALQAWNAMADVGRMETVDEQLREAEQKLRSLETMSGSKRKLEEQRALVESLRAKRDAEHEAARAAAERQRVEAEGIAASAEVIELRRQHATVEEKLSAALEKYRSNLAAVAKANPDSPLLDPRKVEADEKAIRASFERMTVSVRGLGTARSEADRAAAAAAREAKRAAEENLRKMESMDRFIADLADKEVGAAEAVVKSLDAQARSLEDQIELYGMTEAQIALVSVRRAEERLEIARQNGESAGLLAALEREVELRRQIAGAAGTLDAQRANAEAAQEAAREWERTSQEIEGAIYDAIVSGGADAGEVLERTFKALVLRPIVQPIAQGVAGLVTGALGLGGSGATAGGLGGLGGLNNLSTAWSALSGGMSASLGGLVSGAGSFLGSSTLGAFGAGMQGSTLAAGLAGPTTTGASGAMGLGASFGSALPWLAGGLAIANALGAFKGPSYHSGAAVSYGADDVSALLGHKQAVGDTRVWGGFSEVDGKGGKVYADALTALARGATDTVEAALKAFGAGGSVSAYAAFGADGDDASRGALRLYDEAGKLLAANSDQLLRGAKYAKDPQKGFEQYGADAGRVVRDALIAADLPAWVDDVIGSLGDGVSVEQLSAVIGELSNFADQAADDTSLWQRATRSLHEEFASLGVEMPRTKAEFHALIQSSGDLGAELFALAPAFYELSAAVDAAFASISTTTAASVRDIEMALLDNEGKYAYLDGEIDRLLGEIQTAYDPGTIQALFEQANSKMMESWRLLDLNSMGDAEQKRVQSSFIDRFYELEALAQARLSVAPVDDAAERQAASADKAAAALDAAADRLLAATSGLGAEAAAGIRAAAGDLRAAASNIQVTVRVAGGSEVGYANT